MVVTTIAVSLTFPFGGGSSNTGLPSLCKSPKILHLHMGPLVMLLQISDLEEAVMETRALNTLEVHLGKAVRENFMMGILWSLHCLDDDGL